ncbi:acetylglutamate kinase [Priestia megaterium]|uniref:acetylglutamate kinase n=1 Tax=Priestia megaterium TaxID=1404 RepID=UPI002452C78F|nr:acetylglutamate kinase [Priestia megaterium]MDH3144084.1 acetylglutamate kinase [Priestia megaterium]MED4235965.1 acetylglutamate kinase [Priestia megaterium]MED4253610.1 acetylglutamate kinase [Priestia megaterium]MED4263012.1 acetylglutamate kinase [Priestia megaterium]MED4277108.1 acetylglutamate kinase [Priestia megaterium]
MSSEKIVVVKCGGSIVNQLTSAFFESIQQLKASGYQIIVVHGGGPDIQDTLTKLHIETEFVDGLRKTSKEALEVVTMVLAGKVNKQLVKELQKANLRAVGLSGIDGLLLQAEAIDVERLGYVGEVKGVNDTLLKQLTDSQYIPVVSSIGADEEGNSYNINADVAAGAVAKAVNAEKLMFVTDVKGVLKDGALLPELTKSEIDALIEEKVIYGGMIPKVTSAVNALSPLLEEVHIISGTDGFLDKEGKLIGTAIKYSGKGGEDSDEFIVSNISTV